MLYISYSNITCYHKYLILVLLMLNDAFARVCVVLVAFTASIKFNREKIRAFVKKIHSVEITWFLVFSVISSK